MPRTAATPARLTHSPFRATDAIAKGLITRRQLDGPAWRRLFQDVYAHADLSLDHLTWCRAASLLIAGTDAAVSGLSAACVWGANVVPRDAPVEITTQEASRIRSSARLTVVRSTLTSIDVARRGGIPVTSPLRTAFDIARRLPRVEAVIGVDALCHARLVTPDRIRAYAATNPGWPGLPQLKLVLVLVDPNAESPMETRLRLVLVDAGLPRPVAQHLVQDRAGRIIARLDLAYVHKRLGIEYDGDQHRERGAFVDDLRRQNALRALGWTLLRFTAADIYRNPGGVVATVRAALAT